MDAVTPLFGPSASEGRLPAFFRLLPSCILHAGRYALRAFLGVWPRTSPLLLQTPALADRSGNFRRGESIEYLSIGVIKSDSDTCRDEVQIYTWEGKETWDLSENRTTGPLSWVGTGKNHRSKGIIFVP